MELAQDVVRIMHRALSQEEARLADLGAPERRWWYRSVRHLSEDIVRYLFAVEALKEKVSWTIQTEVPTTNGQKTDFCIYETGSLLARFELKARRALKGYGALGAIVSDLEKQEKCAAAEPGIAHYALILLFGQRDEIDRRLVEIPMQLSFERVDGGDFSEVPLSDLDDKPNRAGDVLRIVCHRICSPQASNP